ncbi:methylsterol monooxygenase 1-1-like [Impatiens glandulifera]|uniref:methylsterol monooxygenase 1-1-like n=1 Tax=Impatiens glandulifera TaxID=253017 RepID=UPI001FB0BD27|nr:methylsterol monooxygenase 1-1-like [Impatiens glandulifera]
MLPYKSVPAAEAVLGRALTAGETIWLNYSADKSDYFLYCHTTVFLFLTFSISPFFYILFEQFQTYKIQPKVKKLSISDSLRCYLNVMPMFILVVGSLQLISYPAIQMIGIRTKLPLPSIGEVVGQLVVYFAIEDYTSYWVHRFLHCNKWVYEKIHRIHHEYNAPFVFVALYAHWAEILILGFPSLLGPAIAPGHIITFWLWIALRQLEAIETHSGYEFPWSPAKYIPFYGGAEHHDYHHYVGGESYSNFSSVFTYCDYIYGTDKGYRYHKKIRKQR